MTEAERIAWAAGLFEGEGSIGAQTTCAHGNVRVRVRFTLAMTDRDVLERFHAIVGAGSVTGPFWYDKSTRHIWRWCASSRPDVARLTDMFRPFLCERRLRALNEALHAFREQPPPAHKNRERTHCRRGHPFSDGNTRVESTGSRRCLTCERDRERHRVRSGDTEPLRSTPEQETA